MRFSDSWAENGVRPRYQGRYTFTDLAAKFRMGGRFATTNIVGRLRLRAMMSAVGVVVVLAAAGVVVWRVWLWLAAGVVVAAGVAVFNTVLVAAGVVTWLW